MTLTRNSTQKKMTKMTWPLFAAAALALTLLTAARPAAAAPAAAIPVFGSVDITKLQTQSTKKTKYDTELRALADKLQSVFQQQASSLMLSAADQNELGTLLGSTRPTDSDRARITALQTKADQANQQFISLQQKKDPTPADTAQLGALTDMNNAAQATLKAIGDGYQARIKKLSDDDNTAFTQSVKEAIAAAAQQRGISVVFTSDIAVYTANDITEDVVKRINK